MNDLARAVLLSLSALMLAVSVASAQEVEGNSYRAPADYPQDVYFGDAHVHTVLSMDAAGWGVQLMPEDSWRYAKGEVVKSLKGWDAQLLQPLDWMVIADHTDGYGFFSRLKDGDPWVTNEELGKRWYDLLQDGTEASLRTVADEIIRGFSTEGGTPWDVTDPEMVGPGWETSVNAAEEANDPGKFTAFIGYEWSALVQGDNMHRVVIYRDDADKALQQLPLTFGETIDPEDLWDHLQAYEDMTGGQVLAIPHNGNWSNGRMFAGVKLDGRPLDAAYAEARMRWEPLYEMTQIKGDGETHPFLSPDDEFADFETWDTGNLTFTTRVTTDMLPGSYARSGLKLGLQHEARLGANPFQFGQIGASDTHTGFAGQEESQFMGKGAQSEPAPNRWEEDFRRGEIGVQPGWSENAGSLAGVWAKENTREALWDAMKRKEVYATTGTRIKVRMFGGWDFKPGDDQRPDYVALGYEKGVPMGGELYGDPNAAAVRRAFEEGKTAQAPTLSFLGYGDSKAEDPDAPGEDYIGIADQMRRSQTSPTFLVAAVKDPLHGNLDRVQMIKGWLDANGELHEKVYDIVWSDDRTIDPITGKLSPVGNTINMADATYTNSIGDVQLSTVWKDPDFDPDELAFYYVRVIEIPTPRWTLYDAVRFNVEMDPEIPMITQERAYTSPIWYTPAK